MPGQTPHDLAIYVYGRLSNKSHRPSIATLDELFHTLYLTSMRKEEGTPITCSIAYVNPKSPDPDPPENIRHPRWTVALFSNPIEYSAIQLTKLALAADPASSCLIVYPNRKNELQIWGLIDQQGGFQAMLTHEAEGGWSPPGVFHVQILGPGHLVVMDEIVLIAELNGDHLVEDSVDVFLNSAIHRKFQSGFRRHIDNISANITHKGYKLQPNIVKYAYSQWIRTIRRILLRARTFGHGGAFLFTDSPSAPRLNTKYAVVYDRLPCLLENLASSCVIEDLSYDIISDQIDGGADTIQIGPYIDKELAKNLLDDVCEALSGAIAYVASLSRVDGLVLMDYDLVVHGFGCEITAKGNSKRQAYRATHSSPTKGNLRLLDLQRFGTRHRSMIRYCSEDMHSVGFVVSHDGPVRAVSCSSSRLYFWDNVQLSMRDRKKQDRILVMQK